MVRIPTVAFAALIVLVLVVSGSQIPMARASAAPSPAMHARPQGPVLGITVFNSYGWGDDFQVGLGAGDLYFRAYDSGTATNGTVQIVDQNYSRDGVPAVAASWQIQFVDHENDSQTLGLFYQIPLDLNWSGTWEITLNASNETLNQTFTVYAFDTYVDANANTYLPGGSGTLYYYNERWGGEPFSAFQTLQFVAAYTNSTGHVLKLPGFPSSEAPSATGSISFTIPTNASPGTQVYFWIWANQTSGKYNFSTWDDEYVTIGSISGVEISFLTCSPNCPNFANGQIQIVEISVLAGYYDGSSYVYAIANGLSLTISYFDQSTNVAAPAGAPTSLTTNASGQASFIFIPSSTEFSTTHNNSIHVNVTDPLDTALTAANSIDFNVVPTSSVARVQVTLPELVYHSGDTVNASWSIGGANASGAAGWTASWWDAWTESSPYETFASGLLDTTSDSGTVSFTLPATYEGTVEVEVGATNQSETEWGTASTTVVAPQLILNPSEATYRAGDTVTVTVTEEGQAFAGATLYYEAADDSGNVLSAGTVSGDSFSVKVPTVAAPTEILFHVAAQMPGGGILATASTSVDLQSGYALSASIQTSSSYSDGSYQPGESISIGYSLVPLGTTPAATTTTILIVPNANELALYFGEIEEMPGVEIRTVPTASGSIGYTLPSGLPNGYSTLLVFAYPSSDTACSYLYSGCAAFTQITVNVQSSPSALNYQIGAGSGFTVGFLILLLLILVVALIGAVWLRRRLGGSGGSRSSPPKTFTPPPSMSPGGSPGTTANWSESPPAPPKQGP